MSKKHEVHKRLADAMPEEAAASLVKHAISLLYDASSLLHMAGRRREDREESGSEGLLALARIGEHVTAKAIGFEDMLLGTRAPVHADYIITRVVEIASVHAEYAFEYPSFIPTMMRLAEFLTEELGEGWPIGVLCPDGADVAEDGTKIVHAWAFTVLPFDTTSYIRPPESGHLGDGVTWMGTTWEPGCECDDLASDDEHRPGCPAVSKGG